MAGAPPGQPEAETRPNYDDNSGAMTPLILDEPQSSTPGEEEREHGVVGRVGLRQDPACLYPGG